MKPSPIWSSFERLPKRMAEAAARLQDGEDSIPVTVALACFESPKPKSPQ